MQNKKNEKLIKMIITVIVIILLVWFLIISPLLKFKSMEKEVLDASKRYFEINTSALPTGNKIRKISLQTLYDKDYIDKDLRAPYTNKYCDSENSWVRVMKDGNEYKYNVYLECGMFKSKTDHKGPTIKLKGKDEVTTYLGEKYKDAGIESVIDDTDGKININKVKVDTSKVNINKVGTYEVTYTISDSLDNQTKQIRTVKVIQTLNNVVKKGTDKSNTYKGNNEGSYLKLDGILFKAVGINSDGTVKVVSDENLGSVNYDGIDSWLNDYFYEKLSDSAKEYIVKSKWCNEKVKDPSKYTKCNEYSKKKYVGLLSIADYNNSKDENSVTYLNNNTAVWLYNSKNNKEAWINSYYDAPNFNTIEYKNSSKNEIVGIKPALNIKEDASIISGSGSNVDPYILENNKKKIKNGDKISKAVTGSYINYSGYDFRVISKEDDGTTKVIMIDPLTSSNGTFYTKYDNKLETYNPKTKTNLGYIIVNNSSEFIKTNYFDSKTVEIKEYGNNVLYDKEKSVKEYKIKLSAASLFDLYSAHTTNGVSTWYQETSNRKIYLNSATVGTISENFDENETNGIKLVGYLNKNVVVKSGDGSKFNPFKLTK